MVGGGRGTPANTPTVGGVPGAGRRVLRELPHGIFRPFAENNVPVDFIHGRDLESADLSQYKLIIFPCPIIVSPGAAAGLKRICRTGRLADGRSEAGLEQRARLQRGRDTRHGVERVRNPRNQGRDPGGGPNDVGRQQPSRAVPAQERRGRARRAVRRVGRAPASEHGQVLAHLDDGTPAITSSSYRQGADLLLRLVPRPGDATGEQGELPVAPGAPDRAKSSGRSRRRSTERMRNPRSRLVFRRRPDGRVLFLINHANAAKSVAIKVNMPGGGNFALREILRGQTLRQSATGNTLTLTRDIPAKKSEVWDITKAGTTPYVARWATPGSPEAVRANRLEGANEATVGHHQARPGGHRGCVDDAPGPRPAHDRLDRRFGEGRQAGVRPAPPSRWSANPRARSPRRS